MSDEIGSTNVNQAKAYATQDDVASSASLPFWGAIYQFAAGTVGTGFKLLDQTRPVLLFATKTSASITSRLQMTAITGFLCGGNYGLLVGQGNLTYSSPTTANTGNGASAALLAANTSRKYAIITNTSANTVYLGIGVAAENAKGIYLTQNQSYEFSPLFGNHTTAAINGYAAATSACTVQEAT